MKFDICVGNPPYGKKKQGTYDIHFKIMNTILPICKDKLTFIMPSKPLYSKVSDNWYNMLKNAVCVDIKPQSKSVFKGTEMEQTAIYYCDRNEIPENYCKKLDVEDNFINTLNETEKKFVKYMTSKGNLEIFKSFKLSERDKDKIVSGIILSLKPDKYYLNTMKANGAMGAKWLSDDLEKYNVLTSSQEEEYIKTHTETRNIFECPNEDYGKNLLNLMSKGKLLRFSLWLTQHNQDILQHCCKFLPNVNYSEIDSDKKLLKELGCTNPEEQKEILDYVNNFDFTQRRNDRFLKSETPVDPEDSSPSGSVSSKTVLDN